MIITYAGGKKNLNPFLWYHILNPVGLNDESIALVVNEKVKSVRKIKIETTDESLMNKLVFSGAARLDYRAAAVRVPLHVSRQR